MFRFVCLCLCGVCVYVCVCVHAHKNLCFFSKKTLSTLLNSKKKNLLYIKKKNLYVHIFGRGQVVVSFFLCLQIYCVDVSMFFLYSPF